MAETQKIKDAKAIIARYELGGCYTVDDWNVYAGACKALGFMPKHDPQDKSYPHIKITREP